MTLEDKAALRQMKSMLTTGHLYGGTIRQRAQFVVAISNALTEIETVDTANRATKKTQ